MNKKIDLNLFHIIVLYWYCDFTQISFKYAEQLE